MDRALERRVDKLREYGEKLGLVNPFAILARGYAVAYREGAKSPLTSAAAVHPGERIRVRLHEGELRAIVRGVPPKQVAGTGPEGPCARVRNRPADEGDFGPLFSDATEETS